ncbi:NCS2 family permease [Pelomyxa schiedti]|nr:NCS2 family permease [Pelomyxa schiedti]
MGRVKDKAVWLWGLVVKYVLVWGHPNDAKLVYPGDLDAFCFTFIDNVCNFSLTYTLLVDLIGFDPLFVQQHVIPGAGICLLLGSLFYWWLARRLARSTPGIWVTALPFGISTPSQLAFVSLIMLPESLRSSKEEAYNAVLCANLVSGVVESLTAIFGDFVLMFCPQPALLSVLAGIALGTLSVSSIFRLFQYPWVGGVTLLLFIFAQTSSTVIRVKRLIIPWSLLAILVGTGIGWIYVAAGLYKMPTEDLYVGCFYPRLAISEIISGFLNSLNYISVFLPLAFMNGIGSLQVIAAARKCQNSYSQRSALLCNGIMCVISALLGNPFPTTLFLGHTTFNQMRASSAYMLFEGVGIFLVALFGLVQPILLAVPFEAILPVIVVLGFDMTALAFVNDDDLPLRYPGSECKSPRRHIFAVAMGMTPALALLGVQGVQAALISTGADWTTTIPQIVKNGYYIGGAIALSQGFLLSGMLLSAVGVFFIDRLYLKASIAFAMLSALSWLGLIHSYTITQTGYESLFVGINGTWIAAPAFVVCYALFGVFMLWLYILTPVCGFWVTTKPLADPHGYFVLPHSTERLTQSAPVVPFGSLHEDTNTSL